MTNLMNAEEAGRIITALSDEDHATKGKPQLSSDLVQRMGAKMRKEILKIDGFSLAAMPRRMTDFEIHKMDEGMSYAIPNRRDGRQPGPYRSPHDAVFE